MTHNQRQQRRQLTDAERAWFDRSKGWVDSFVRRLRVDGQIRDTDTALFARSLAQILARPFDRRYPGLMTESMMARGEPIDMAAATVMSQGHEVLGEATVTSTYQDPVATVTIQGQEHPQQMFGIVAKWHLSYQQIRQAAMARVALPSKLADGAYRIVARQKDRILAIGHAASGISGMINNANIPVRSGGVADPVTGFVYTGRWDLAATTDDNIIADVGQLIATVRRDSLFAVTDMAVADTEWARLIQPRTAAGYSPNLKTVIENTFGIKVTQFSMLNNMAVNPVFNRTILYEKTLDVFNPMITAGPEQFPPVPDDTGYSITVHDRVGGVESMSPTGAVYFDQDT